MKKKQFCLFPVALVGFALIACGNSSSDYKVTLNETEAIEIDVTSAKKNQDYDANLKIKDLYNGFCAMPDEIAEIIIGGTILDSGYTFSKISDNSASIHIDGSCVKGEIKITLHAIANQGNITFNSPVDQDGDLIYNLSTTSYVYGDDINAKFGFEKIGVTDDQSKYYDLPAAIKKVTTENANEDITSYCDYNKATGVLHIPAKTESGVYIMDKHLTVEVEANRPKYTGNTFTSNSLKLMNNTTEFLPDVYKGQELNFKIEVNETNESEIVPDTLDVTVGGKKLYIPQYEIIPIEGTENKQATVKIKHGLINGTVEVKGEAKEPSQYTVEQDLLGVTSSGAQFATAGTKYEATFTADSSHEVPTKENVVVKLPGKDWQSFAEPVDGCEYDETTHKLTIEANYVTGPIAIAVKAHDISLLEYMTATGKEDWSEVRAASAKGYAYYLFDIGEESATFTIDEVQYKARLIGIDRDKSKSMTFEFTTCIPVAQPFSSSYKINSYYYRNSQSGVLYESALHKYLNETLYNKLPFKSNIASVSKKTVIGKYSADLTAKTDIYESSINYLFPLSLSELGYDVSSLKGNPNVKKELPSIKAHGATADGAYEYYANNEDLTTRIKKIAGVDKAVKYWVRTPYLETSQVQTYTIRFTDGNFSSSNPSSATDIYVAPAFCM